MKLSSDVSALKEVVESFNKKQTEFAEVQNKHKLSEEKHLELKKDFRNLEEKYASKISECAMLEETLKKLSDRLSKLEITNSEYVEKLNDFKENYAKVDIENKRNIEKLKECQENEIELKRKLRVTEEKYTKLELTLKEFQGKYMEECKNHEELQETLSRLQNRSSSGRCSSRSSDSLKPVYEDEEYDEISEKLNRKLNVYEKEQPSKNEALNEPENYNEIFGKDNILVNLLMRFQSSGNKHNLYLTESERAGELKVKKSENILNEKELECKNLLTELNERCKLLSDHDKIVRENEELCNRVKDLEMLQSELTEKLSKRINEYDELKESFDKCKVSFTALEAELEAERAKCKNDNELSANVNEFKELVNEKSVENRNLVTKIEVLERSLSDTKANLDDMTQKHSTILQQMAEQKSMLELAEKGNSKLANEIRNLSSVLEEKDIALSQANEKLKRELAENERLLKELREREVSLVELKKNYDSAIMEKDKLIEICESDKSAEEIFKANICQLKEELTALREENNEADKRYKQMEMKLEESRVISELLKKEIDGKCDEYDAFKKEMEFYKLKNDELNKEMLDKEKQCEDYKSRCDELNKAEKEKTDLIDNLLKELETTRESLKNAEENADRSNQILQESFSFETISLKNEKYSSVLRKYIKDNNIVDSSFLIEDLDNMRVEVEMLRNKATKPDEGTEVSAKEEYICKMKELRERLVSLNQTVAGMKSFRAKIHEEMLECVSSFRTENARVIRDIVRKISDVISNLKNGNQELLSEMNVMNQVGCTYKNALCKYWII